MVFTVTWTINVDAATHEEAARLAREAQVREDTTALCFAVQSRRGERVYVDLLDQRETKTDANSGRF